MIRGTTPLHEIILPTDASNFKEVLITFSTYEGKDIILEKHLSDMEVDGQKLTYRLTQEETLKFPEEDYVRYQVRAVDHNDHAFASIIKEIGVRDVLNETVIGTDPEPEEGNEDTD